MYKHIDLGDWSKDLDKIVPETVSALTTKLLSRLRVETQYILI